jgi:hypothetical protein
VKEKLLYIYMRKGTTWEQVVGNNDKLQVTSQCPIPKADRSQPHPSRAYITKCNARKLWASGKNVGRG